MPQTPVSSRVETIEQLNISIGLHQPYVQQSFPKLIAQGCLSDCLTDLEQHGLTSDTAICALTLAQVLEGGEPC